MIADLTYENKPYRFRVGLVSNYKTGNLDYELTCISEDFPDKLKCKRFDYEVFKKYWRDGVIKVTI